MAATDSLWWWPIASDWWWAINMRPVTGVSQTNTSQQADSEETETWGYSADLNSLNLMTAELASLIYWNFAWNYRELLKSDFSEIKIIKKTLSELKATKSEEVSDILKNPFHELDGLRKKAIGKVIAWDIWRRDSKNDLSLEEFLNVDLDSISANRMEELLSNELVKSRFDYELKERKDNLETMERAKPFLSEIKKYESLIEKARKRILEIKVIAFRESRKLNVKEISYIDSVRSKIWEIRGKINELKGFREIAAAYRLDELLNFKRQFDKTWFVRSESRDAIIEEIQNSILLWKNVLLTWATGTGKTVLAVEAVREISKLLHVWFVSISGNKLAWELSSPETKKEFDNFVEVFSWTPDAKASDFIAKQRLRAWPNWWTETYTEMWKILKAFTENKIPIMDEIDLIPNDTLMRIKHLFTKRPWEYYSPQEDGNTKYQLKTVNIVATANIKSAKHQDREDIDPAIIRLFDNIHVNYLPKEEVYDLALVSIMDKSAFIYKVSIKELQDENSTLARLVYCLKRVEENYLWIWAWENISNRDKQFLKKAVLELGKFVWLFNWFASSWLEFSRYLKKQVIDFVTNMAYPKSDRLILIKIFSEKWFITKSDVWTKENPWVLLRIMDDISIKELEDNILVDNYEFDMDSRVFLDPFELANLDAFNVRKLGERPKKFTKSDILWYLNNLDRILQNSEHEWKEPLEELINDILTNHADGDNLEFPEDKKMPLVALMYQLALRDELLDLKKIKWFEELVTKIILIDSRQKKVFYDSKWEYIPDDMKTNSDSSDEAELKKKQLIRLKSEIENKSWLKITDFIEPRKSWSTWYWALKLDDDRIIPFCGSDSYSGQWDLLINFCEWVQIGPDWKIYCVALMSNGRSYPFTVNSLGSCLDTKIWWIEIEKASNVTRTPDWILKWNIRWLDWTWYEFIWDDLVNANKSTYPIAKTGSSWSAVQTAHQDLCSWLVTWYWVKSDYFKTFVYWLVSIRDWRTLPFVWETIFETIWNHKIAEIINLEISADALTGKAKTQAWFMIDFKISVENGKFSIENTATSNKPDAKVNFDDWRELKNKIQDKYKINIDDSTVDLEGVLNWMIFWTLILQWASAMRVPFLNDELAPVFVWCSVKDSKKITFDWNKLSWQVLLDDWEWYEFSWDMLLKKLSQNWDNPNYQNWAILKHILENKYSFKISAQSHEIDLLSWNLFWTIALSDWRTVPHMGDIAYDKFWNEDVMHSRKIKVDDSTSELTGEVEINSDWYEFSWERILDIVPRPWFPKIFTDLPVLMNILKHNYTLDIKSIEHHQVNWTSGNLYWKLILANWFKIPFYWDFALSEDAASKVIDCDEINIDAAWTMSWKVRFDDTTWHSFNTDWESYSIY
ncbi:MAG: hypothetical protein ACD_2C00027G0017 [uncultured bacterium (gcode 4)]|uniref:ATPase dynein-related AAA domain-containing protein n=1 Tax=uncultured bacterium (gcode 4) TaxID=1234023 RepID=K2GIE6_9BACT|nr:MAG: hypothetical protein ACD_2C00027G0017 [uncultured bacterium (gcode 4)]